MSDTTRKVLYLVSLLVACSLAMQQVHELGHVIAAWITGGVVTHVNLLPWTISRTDVNPNPHSLVVVWGGPWMGVILPILAWSLAVARRWKSESCLRFFAGFCLVVNGLYIGLGQFGGIGDAGNLLHAGASRPGLSLFGLTATLAGFVLWNGQGPKFGLGREGRQISPGETGRMVGLAIILAACGTAMSFIF